MKYGFENRDFGLNRIRGNRTFVKILIPVLTSGTWAHSKQVSESRFFLRNHDWRPLLSDRKVSGFLIDLEFTVHKQRLLLEEVFRSDFQKTAELKA
ncbi:hypothetical protein AVEN_96677-1 [Araneus ventricosus]|uniref:Uncharacterized protein n=1 Tax=Araneus ventricosus TaxID=182803 RepID=A0A4Y2EBB9_ARAVE|nr:hypothetical protein AVEN_96677-1 [Araneus ventricosus]